MSFISLLRRTPSPRHFLLGRSFAWDTQSQEKALANAQREMENYRKCGDRCGEVGGEVKPTVSISQLLQQKFQVWISFVSLLRRP